MNAIEEPADPFGPVWMVVTCGNLGEGFWRYESDYVTYLWLRFDGAYTKGQLRAVINRLVKRGVLERWKEPNQRYWKIRLTGRLVPPPFELITFAGFRKKREEEKHD